MYNRNNLSSKVWKISTVRWFTIDYVRFLTSKRFISRWPFNEIYMRKENFETNVRNQILLVALMNALCGVGRCSRLICLKECPLYESLNSSQTRISNLNYYSHLISNLRPACMILRISQLSWLLALNILGR